MLQNKQSRDLSLREGVLPILLMTAVIPAYLALTALAFGVSFVGSVRAQPTGPIWFWTSISTVGIPMILAFYFGLYLNKRIFWKREQG